MWQHFTEFARRTVLCAQEEASRLGVNFVSTEHLLLGIARQPACVGMLALVRLGIAPDEIRGSLESHMVRGDNRPGRELKLTPRAQRVFDLAYDEARQWQDAQIGTDHLLLGLIREGEGLGGLVLGRLGVTLERTRESVFRVREAGMVEADPPAVAPEPEASQPPAVGDLGLLEASPERPILAYCAFAGEALERVYLVLETRDPDGWQELEEEGILRRLTERTDAKLLRFSGGPPACALFRLLTGPDAHALAWVDLDRFSRVGPDPRPFPPEPKGA